MATTIQVVGDTIKIDKVFVSGKDRIAVNGEVVFEGKLSPGTPQDFTAGSREYTLESRTVSKMTSAVAIHVHVRENGEPVHSGIYDLAGKPVASEQQAKAAGAIHACAMVGAVAGFTTMMTLNLATGVVPGGAIGGALGGGGGAMVGYGLGALLFGRKS